MLDYALTFETDLVAAEVEGGVVLYAAVGRHVELEDDLDLGTTQAGARQSHTERLHLGRYNTTQRDVEQRLCDGVLVVVLYNPHVRQLKQLLQ